MATKYSKSRRRRTNRYTIPLPFSYLFSIRLEWMDFFFSSYYFFRTIVLLARQRVKGRRLCLRANISIMEWNKYGNNNNNDKKKMIKRKRNKYWGKERRNVKIKYSIWQQHRILPRLTSVFFYLKIYTSRSDIFVVVGYFSIRIRNSKTRILQIFNILIHFSRVIPMPRITDI